jgi:hypothetical protein
VRTRIRGILAAVVARRAGAAQGAGHAGLETNALAGPGLQFVMRGRRIERTTLETVHHDEASTRPRALAIAGTSDSENGR